MLQQQQSQLQSQEQQHISVIAKKLKKKKGKKALTAASSEISSVSGASSSRLVASVLMEGAVVLAPIGKGKKATVTALMSATVASTNNECWTHVEAWKKKASVLSQDDMAMAVGPTTR